MKVIQDKIKPNKEITSETPEVEGKPKGKKKKKAKSSPESAEKKPAFDPNWTKNAKHQVEITGYNGDGAGVARVDGRVIFIPDTIKGELWDIILLKVKPSYAHGKAVECVKPSPSRLESDCKFSAKCGGCQLRHMDYQEELRLKQEIVESAISRIGGVSATILPILGSKEQDHYRNKVQYQVSGSDSWVKVGFFRARSHDVLDVSDCKLQKESATIARRVLKTWMEEFHVNPYDEKTKKGTIRHLFLRCNEKDELDLCLVATRQSVPYLQELTKAFQEELPQMKYFSLIPNKEDSNVILNGEQHHILSKDSLEIGLFDQPFQVRTKSFFQVNQPQTETLYSVVGEMASLTGTENILDLYCGTGSIGIYLAKKGKTLTGIEVSPDAIADAKVNAERNQITQAQFFCQDCQELPPQLTAEDATPYDVVVVDPPRKGLQSPQQILPLVSKKLIYVSCDPATLARDLKYFQENGLQVRKIQPVDMFPRTKHVETVVLLEKV